MDTMQKEMVAPQNREQIVTRHFDAPCAEVWQAWTNS